MRSRGGGLSSRHRAHAIAGVHHGQLRLTVQVHETDGLANGLTGGDADDVALVIRFVSQDVAQ